MKYMQEGHTPRVKEQDIAYAFKMNSRTEKFDVKTDDIDAHTFKIMEIIEEEKNNVRQKELQGMKYGS